MLAEGHTSMEDWGRFDSTLRAEDRVTRVA